MNRVALLSAGPSLRRVWCEDFFCEYDCVVAVNTAGWFFTHHWLCAFDSHCILPVLKKEPDKHLPLVGIRTSMTFARQAAERGWRSEVPPLYVRVGVTDDMFRETGERRAIFTFPNALHFCLTKWPGAGVDIYGMDYKIGAPCIGNVGGDRGEKRFRREAKWVRALWDDSRVRVFGDASPALLDYFAKRRADWLP